MFKLFLFFIFDEISKTLIFTILCILFTGVVIQIGNVLFYNYIKLTNYPLF